jgi:hypothetical protein
MSLMNLSLKSFLPARDLGWNHTRSVCAMPDCHNKLLMRPVPGSRAGIYVGETWYCSPDCFSLDARKTLASLSLGCVVEMPRSPRLSLGLSLLSRGYISEDQLRFAMDQSRRESKSLEVTLIKHAIVSEKQLAAARAAQWGYPALASDAIGQIVEADLPPSLLRACSAAPVHYSAKAKRLVLGFVRRVDHSLLQSIEQITGCRAEPCFITPSEFSEQMERLKPVAGYQEVVVDNPGNVAQMGRVLGGFAVDITAREAAFAKCRSTIWTRIAGKRGTVDVLFPLQNPATNARRDFPSDVPEVTEALG